MATIPSGQKFHTLASFVETEEKGSALVNSGREIYTMQDIIDTVPAGAAVNPTSGVIPYNSGGVFADSGFTYEGPSGFEKTILVHNDGSNDRMNLNSFNGIYSFGSAQGISGATTNGGFASNLDGFAVGNAASASVGAVSAYNGLAIDGVGGEAIIGCGMSSPSNGVFRASSGYGTAWIGNGIDQGIGHNFISGRMHVGFGLIQNTGTYSQVAWIKVTDEIANEYYIPLYQ